MGPPSGVIGEQIGGLVTMVFRRLRTTLVGGLAAALLAAILPAAVAPLPAQAAVTRSVRWVAVTPAASAYVDKSNPKKSYLNPSVLKVSNSRYTGYLSFNRIAIGAGEAVTGASLTVYTSSANTKTSTGVVARLTSWNGKKTTYKTRPKLGTTVSAATKVVKKTRSTIALRAQTFGQISSAAGLDLGLVHSKKDVTVEFAARGANAPKLTVAITKTTVTPDPGAPVLISDRNTTVFPASTTELGAPVKAAGLGGRLVFAHYFTPYPLSLSNEQRGKDYYLQQYTNPHATAPWEEWTIPYGGLLRDRPIPVEAGNPSTFVKDNLKTEINQAKAAGLDGFAVDLLSVDSSLNANGVYNDRNWAWTVALLEAANEVGGFKIMLQPDMWALVGGKEKATQAQVVAALVKLAAYPAVFKDKTGVVISPFNAEQWTPAQWSSTMNALKSSGVTPSLIPLFLNAKESRNASWDAVVNCTGYSEWGARTPANVRSLAGEMHSAGKTWMQPVAVQDSRPKEGGNPQWTYPEAQNSATLRQSWQAAISSGADMVLLPTWNDYSETTSFAPSVQHGYSILDLNAYYLSWFKTGRAPASFAHETLILSHLNQRTDVPASTFQHAMRQKIDSAATNKVEVVSMLNQPADIHLAVGNKLYSYTAPAGLFVATVSIETNAYVSAEFVRGGVRQGSVNTSSAANDNKVLAAPQVQDLGYRFASSSRALPPKQ